MTCSKRPNEATSRFVAIGVVLAATVFGSPSLGTTVCAQERSADSPVPALVFSEGKLSANLRDADLEHVLRQVAERADFQLTTSGPLKRVTAVFIRVSLEEGLRRLVQDHELMLVYRPSGDARVGGTLVEVHVFAASASSNPAPASATFGEINQLLRSGGGERGLGRLTELLSSAADVPVRARAAWALGRIGGRAAGPALVRALSDGAPEVRIQAVYAFRRVQGLQAIPALADVVLRDPEASVRRAAVGALGSLRDPSAISALRAAAADPDHEVRQQATRALRRQGVVVQQ